MVKDIIAFAIGWGACIAAFCLVYEVLIAFYWAWWAYVCAVCAGGAMLIGTQQYARDIAIPSVIGFARGTVQLCSASIAWVREAARRDTVTTTTYHGPEYRSDTGTWSGDWTKTTRRGRHA